VSALRLRYGVTLDRTDVVTRIPHPKHETTLPVVLSVEEVGRFLGAVRNLKHRTMAILSACIIRLPPSPNDRR